MPARITFRGLILFRFPTTGEHAGKFVAHLINDIGLAGGAAQQPGATPARGPHEHDHGAEIQILTGANPDAEMVPTALGRAANVDIVVAGEKRVARAPSFERYVPALANIVANGTESVRRIERGARNTGLIQNTVTVDRGIARVKSLVAWDEGGYPLNGNRGDRGARPSTHAVAKFMGSSVRANMASEVVVEIDDTDAVELRSAQQPQLNGRRRGTDRPNPRVYPGTVEILVTNYEYPRGKPVPWGIDFQWLFEAAGYGTADLAGPEFDAWTRSARQYDEALFEADRALLGGSNRTVGRPFPYIESDGALPAASALTNEYERPLCIFGDGGNG